jgi:hypothetical protein
MVNDLIYDNRAVEMCNQKGDHKDRRRRALTRPENLTSINR